MARIKRALCQPAAWHYQAGRAGALFCAALCARAWRKKESVSLLSLLCETSSIPLLCTAKDFPSQNPLFALDLWASDFYSTLQAPPAPAGRDYTQKLLIL